MGDRVGLVSLYDGLLVAALLVAAWKALFGRSPFGATILFVSYGLLLALVWARLGAPDVALAEAGVGAGLTGALLLGAIRQFEGDPGLLRPRRSRPAQASLAVLAFALAFAILAALLEPAAATSRVPSLVAENLRTSGSDHPVTSVLLNFRAFDTWLELGVLLLASISAITVHEATSRALPSSPLSPLLPQAESLARVLLPLLILIGGIMLWLGVRAPGGAFQAGALIGAGGILLQLAGHRFPATSGGTRAVHALRAGLGLGFSTFLIVAVATVASGRRFLEYPLEAAGLLILLIELAATLSIALTLNVMYARSIPEGEVNDAAGHATRGTSP